MRDKNVLRGLSLGLLPTLLIGAALAGGAGQPPKPEEQTRFEKEINPLIQKYCAACHGAKNPAGGVSLVSVGGIGAIQRDQITWRKVLTQVRERSMPPPNANHPNSEQRELLVTWLTHTLDSAPESLLPKNPGKVLIHRLNRVEYNNTVRDLFGITSNPADHFPADGGGGGGFDNNADTLFVPPVLMERYLVTAGEILNEAKPARVFVVRPGKTITKQEAARQTLLHHATHAFRRPVEPAELTRLMRLYTQATQRGQSFENAVKFALKAVLVSPSFLFRAEQDNPKGGASPVTDYEFASRLSYFLWSSMPDDTLFALAAKGQLRKPGVLDQQVKRMMADPKSRALADNFAGQWLRVRDLYTAARPDPGKFPNYTPALRDAMYQETISFFHSLVSEDASLLRLLDADYTYLNEELAKHYGIAGVVGPEMRRVSLTDHRRGGVLTMASVLTLTSYPLRSSPVLRGKWVLSEVLGTPPPPPPPVVATLSQNDAPEQGLTFRQRLERHRALPQCAGCHSRMDPLGFGLENFDAVGKWRDALAEKPVDASGQMPDGAKFTGPAELKQHLIRTSKEEFVRNLTEKMLSYALGRGLEPYDLPTVRKITKNVLADDCRSSTLLREIVRSYPFQYRQSSP